MWKQLLQCFQTWKIQRQFEKACYEEDTSTIRSLIPSHLDALSQKEQTLLLAYTFQHSSDLFAQLVQDERININDHMNELIYAGVATSMLDFMAMLIRPELMDILIHKCVYPVQGEYLRYILSHPGNGKIICEMEPVVLRLEVDEKNIESKTGHKHYKQLCTWMEEHEDLCTHIFASLTFEECVLFLDDWKKSDMVSWMLPFTFSQFVRIFTHIFNHRQEKRFELACKTWSDIGLLCMEQSCNLFIRYLNHTPSCVFYQTKGMVLFRAISAHRIDLMILCLQSPTVQMCLSRMGLLVVRELYVHMFKYGKQYLSGKEKDHQEWEETVHDAIRTLPLEHPSTLELSPECATWNLWLGFWHVQSQHRAYQNWGEIVHRISHILGKIKKCRRESNILQIHEIQVQQQE